MSHLELIVYRCWYGPLRRPLRAIARKLTGSGSHIRLGPLKGMRFTGPDLVCRMGIYELHLQDAMKEMLKAGDVFYDIGANNGYLSLLGALCVGTSGMVYAFEPLPENARQVRKLMSENNIGNYFLARVAVSNRYGSVDLHLAGNSDSYTPSMIRGNRTQTIRVETTTLDDFAASHRWPTLIKMDIEGAEAMALEGASRMLNDAKAPKWLIEVHSKELEQQAKQILSGFGYRTRALPAPFSRNPFPRHIAAFK